MEHRNRYVQPFTLAEAVLLDVSTISEEITRLQYSIKRLRETQDILQETIQEAESPEVADQDILQAFKENQEVMYVSVFFGCSQEERILILKLALTHKGVTVVDHYDVDPTIKPSSNHNGSIEEDDSGGLHL
ncbi:hypothetical protein BT96DRAFT_889964 [Gymnopus androsaceus JB14]|uniref:Uncharacterized protein n=1 Tax=Gymnopus androsaceus JB14 TaxID=1447944 RepID=A0A6A4GVX1_9AGAR|nr:hypothetical protein BT96DRAFT_889964 [Gymnopus androsaceus JB14]